MGYKDIKTTSSIEITKLLDNYRKVIDTNNNKVFIAFRDRLLILLNQTIEVYNTLQLFISTNSSIQLSNIVNLLHNCNSLNKDSLSIFNQIKKQLINLNLDSNVTQLIHFNNTTIIHSTDYIINKPTITPTKTPTPSRKSNTEPQINKISMLSTEVIDNNICKPPKNTKNGSKKRIPAAVRNMVWDNNISPELKIGNCYVCNSKISFSNFHCGHIIAEKDGGTIELNNLKAICMLCNTSMGTTNMNIFKQQYGFIKPTTNMDMSIREILKHLDTSTQQQITNILFG